MGNSLSKAMPLTVPQQETRDFIVAFTVANGMAPTYREIAGGMSVSSTFIVHERVLGLVERGHATRLIGRRRSIRIITGICPTCGQGGH